VSREREQARGEPATSKLLLLTVCDLLVSVSFMLINVNRGFVILFDVICAVSVEKSNRKFGLLKIKLGLRNSIKKIIPT